MTKRSKEVLKWLVNRALADDHARASEARPDLGPPAPPPPKEDEDLPKKGAKAPPHPPSPPPPASDRPPKLTRPAHDPSFLEPTSAEIQAALNELDSPVHCPLT